MARLQAPARGLQARWLRHHAGAAEGLAFERLAAFFCAWAMGTALANGALRRVREACSMEPW